MQRGDHAIAAWKLSEEARAVQAQQLAQLVEYARVADQMLRSLRPPSSESAS
jgi:hypothetical protein